MFDYYNHIMLNCRINLKTYEARYIKHVVEHIILHCQTKQKISLTIKSLVTKFYLKKKRYEKDYFISSINVDCLRKFICNGIK